MFRNSICLAMATAILLSLHPSVVNAGLIVIDFQSLEHESSGFVSHGTVYSEDGYTLTNDHDLGFVTFGTLDFRYNGSTAMAGRISPSTITLTQDSGGAFAVTSIDLAEMSPDDTGPPVVSFVGSLSGGGTTEQSFTLDGVFPTAEIFFFNSTFENITSLSWKQGPGPAHQFDNITITAVPEPSSMFMVGIGMAILVKTRRRSNQHVSMR